MSRTGLKQHANGTQSIDGVVIFFALQHLHEQFEASFFLHS